MIQNFSISEQVHGKPQNRITEKLVRESVGDEDKLRVVLSQLVRNSYAAFIWGPKYLDVVPKTILNHFRNRIHRTRVSDFCLKEGLHNIAENIQWSTVEDFSELNYPRSFLLLNANQRKLFSIEFETTVLKSFIIFLKKTDDICDLFSADGCVEIDLMHNILDSIESVIKFKQTLCMSADKSSDDVGFTAVHQVMEIMRGNKTFRSPLNFSKSFIEKLKLKISMIAYQISNHWPDSKYDSTNNIWYEIEKLNDSIKSHSHISGFLNQSTSHGAME